MGVLSRLLILCLLLQISSTVSAKGVDVTGTWESVYDFGEAKEIMTAKITQVGESIMGAYTVHPEPSGDDYSGIIIGTIEGDRVKAYYISDEGLGSVMMVTFTDGEVVDEETIEGTYYYMDGNMLELSGDYKAIRV